MVNAKPKVTIFTDGACIGNPGPGGYGIIIVSDGQRKEYSGGYKRTTNNRMELKAAIEGLKTLQQPSRVTLFSDSRYLVDAMTKGWARSWQARGWKRSGREKALNPDLWEELLRLTRIHEVDFVWVQGHAGHPENERCDQLSVAAAKQRNLPADPGYETEVEPPRLF